MVDGKENLIDKNLGQNESPSNMIDLPDKQGKEMLSLLGDYEREKFASMKSKLSNLVEIMRVIGEYINKADNLGIYIKKDFTFDEIYRTGGFDETHGQVNYSDLRNKFMGYSYDLQNAVNKGERGKGYMKNMGDYEREKFASMKSKLSSLVETMDIISEYIDKANKLGVNVKKDFTFDEIYRTSGFDGTELNMDFKDINDKFLGYSYKLQKAVNEKND